MRIQDLKINKEYLLSWLSENNVWYSEALFLCIQHSLFSWPVNYQANNCQQNNLYENQFLFLKSFYRN